MKHILLSLIMAMTCAVAMAQQGPQVEVNGGIIEGIDSS